MRKGRPPSLTPRKSLEITLSEPLYEKISELALDPFTGKQVPGLRSKIIEAALATYLSEPPRSRQITIDGIN